MLPTRARTGTLGIPIFGLSLLAGAVPVPVAVALLGAAGCSPQDFEETVGNVGDSTSPPAGSAIAFDELSDDVGTRAATETRVLIKTQQGYEAFFGHAPPAGVDLSRQWVIFYAAGTKPTGGFDANIVSLTRSGSRLLAVTELVSPGAGCAVTQSLTSPYVLAKFDAQTGASIAFAKKNRTQDCGPPAVHCGGIAGIRCPAGSTCVDDPSDSCDPKNGGADCGGICVAAPTVVHCGGFGGFPCPGAGKCVDDPSDSCDPKNGGADCGGICTCVQSQACIRGATFDSSPAVCACVPMTPPPPPPDPCGAVLCPSGNHCESHPVVCITAPCPPVAACVPDVPKVFCGGIAGIPCPGAGRCVDDPSDSCDPNKGGADCGGMCTCIQTVLCVSTKVFDGSPKVCACVDPSPPVCGPVCDIFCQFGHVIDAKGCPTCSCNPPPACPRDKCPTPAPAAPNFTCADGVTIGGPACVPDANGQCGWTIVSCPTPTPTR